MGPAVEVYAFLLTTNLVVTATNVGTRSIVPVPLQVRRKDKAFRFSNRALLCAGLGNGRGGVVVSCLRALPVRFGDSGGRTGRGMISLLVAGSGSRLPSPRDCALRIAPHGVAIRTASKTKLFCNMRALLRVTRPTVKSA